MDLDESMDAFKAPTTFAHRRRETRKMKTHSRKPRKALNSATVEDTNPPSGNPAQSFISVENEQTEEIMLSQEDREVSDANSEDALFPCKTCGELFQSTVFKAHAAVCLRVNFEACRLASGNIENLRCRNRNKPENEEGERPLPICLSPVFHEKAYFCPTCNRDLSSLTEIQRNTHANRCLDQMTTKKSPMKRFLQQKSPEKIISKPRVEELHCQMCTKVLKSRSGYKRHLLRCQKKKGFSTMSVLALNKPEKDEEIDVDLLAEIQRSERREQEPETSKEKIMKKRVRKPGSKKDQKDYEDEMLRLALKVSKGEDLTKKVNKREKEVKEMPSVLSTISPNSKREAQKSRIQEILRQEDISDEVDIPSTPSLPPTSLKFSSINESRGNARLVSGVIDPGAGVSVVCTSRSLSRHNNPEEEDEWTDRQPQGVNSRHIRNPVIPPLVPPRPNLNSLTSAGSSNTSVYSESILVRNDELQSPEVSSSNINNASVSDPSDNTVYNNSSSLQRHEGDFQCTVSNTRKPVALRPSKWTMTSESHDRDQKKYTVSGLLSQFEKTKVDTAFVEPILRHSPSEDSPDISNSPAKIEKIETDLSQDIDCTLMNLEKLDNCGMDDAIPHPREADITDQDIENTQTTDNTNASTSNPTENVDCLNETDNRAPLSEFVKAIDNPLCSDGRIVLGKDEEVLHVHLIILFCRCPELYEQVVSAKDNTLFLPEYSKQFFMPFISYVYSDKTGPSVLSELDVALSTLREIARKFNTPIADLSESPEMESCIKSQSQHELPDEDLPGSQNSKTSCDEIDQEENLVYFLSQPSPSQRDTVEEDPEPFLPLPGDPNITEEDLNSDADLFEGTKVIISSPKSLEKINPLSPSKDEPDCDEAALPQADEQLVEQKVEEFLLEVSLASTQTNETGDHLGGINHDKPKIEPKEKRREVRSKHVITPSRRSRRSSSIGRRQHKRRSSCPCCESENSSHSKVAKLGSHRWKRSLKTPQKLWPVSLASKRNKNSITPSKRATVTNTKSKTPLKVFLTGTRNGTGTKTPEKEPGGTPASKKRKCTPETSVHSQEKKKHTPGSVQSNARSSIGHSDTVYVSERLPRFKQREHIRSRPAVANMGKSAMKSMKVPCDRLPRFKQRAHIRSRPAVANMGKSAMKSIRSVEKESVDDSIKNAKSASKLKLSDAVPKRLSLSQPLPSIGGKQDLEVKNDKQGVENEVSKVHKLKKKKLLRCYVNSSDCSPKAEKGSSKSNSGEITGYDSDCGSSDITDDLFNETIETSPSRDSSYQDFKRDPLCAAHTPLPPESSRRASYEFCTDPVPITPMPNFDEMDTPEVRRNAFHYGIKKTLGKTKIKTKLKEAYMYTHQMVSEGEGNNEIEDSPFDELEMDVFNITKSENVSRDEDSGEEELKQFKHTLSRLSASPQIKQQVVENMYYSFDCLTTDEVKSLSTSVVDKMHTDRTLLEALHAMKNKTGSIKRGSRKDKERCWGMVTPGSSGYDPKMNAILMLPEEYQSAITAPLVSCIVKNYIDYKKYMFDCLPVLCDRMEEEMG